jgi:branched-chain amino acid transport system permease protein
MTEMVRVVWGPFPLNAPLPAALSGSVEILPGVPYPTFRLVIIGIGIATAVLLYFFISHTRLGIIIRAGASDRQMIGNMGVNINLLYSIVFGIGVALAALAGSLAGPLSSVQSGMGDRVLILTLVVIVIGGIGSIKGAFIAALLVGISDTIGRGAFPSTLASMVIYAFMVAVLYFRPEGLFPARS